MPDRRISAAAALHRLRAGNDRFVAEVRHGTGAATQARRHELTAGQTPIAIVLGCSDSRVPAELVFDQGLGDLFVIRVAGNIVVVLGHSQCGAVAATLEELRRPSGEQSRNLRAIVDRIRPSVEALLQTDLARNPDALAHAAMRANVRASVDHLRHGSEVLEALILQDGLMVVGAEYSLTTGVVDFFEGA